MQLRTIICTVLTMCVASFAYADSTSDRLNKILAPVKSLRADFQQTVVSEANKVVQNAKGTIEFKRPHNLRWEVLTPDPSLLITDGKKLWNYDQILEQVTIQDFKADSNVSPLSFLFVDQQQLQRDFSIEPVLDQTTKDCFKLTPRVHNPNFVFVEVGFDQQALKFLRLKDHLGQTTLFEFSAVKNNPAISDAEFTFVPPKGTDIIS